MAIQFERGGWVVDNDTLRKLNATGHTVAGLCDGGADMYILYRWTPNGTEIVYETQDIERLNMYVKLILGSNNEDEKA